MRDEDEPRRAPLAWVLNLDAELELAAGLGYAPTKAVRAAMRPHVALLAESLLAPGDVLVDEASEEGALHGLTGRAYCPTPRAIDLLRRAGATPEAHPPFEVLRTVNSRAFSAALGPTLPGGEFVSDAGAAAAMLAAAPPVGRAWRVKRAFGMAGRGHRVVAAGAATAADLAFVRASIARAGGVQIEPDVEIVRELALHAVLSPGEALRVGRVVEQTCDAHGQWRSSELATDVPPDVAAALEGEVRRVADALEGAGYAGPFGIDAFLYRGPDGGVRLQPRSEINARYSMGFAVGFSGFR